MPSEPTDWGKIEWQFLLSDFRFWQLADDDGHPDPCQQLAYLFLWVYSVAIRRDWFSSKRWAIEMVSLASATRLPPDTIEKMVRNSIRSGLIRRMRGNVYLLVGVRSKHRKLRGWCPPYGGRTCAGRLDGDQSTPLTPQGGNLSLRSKQQKLRKQIQDREVTTATRIEDGYTFDVVRVNSKKQITLHTTAQVNYDPFVVGRDDVGLYRWE